MSTRVATHVFEALCQFDDFAVAATVTPTPPRRCRSSRTAAEREPSINKSIKIIGPSGVYGGISVLGAGGGITTGIVINAGDFDEITLRGLDVSGVPTVAPFPSTGIDVQNAGAVHIEKSSVGNFTTDTSACITVDVAKTTRVYIVDSFLRECNISLYAGGRVVVANRPSVIGMTSRQDVGVQFDSVLGGAVSHLEIIGSELTRVTTGIAYANNTATAQGQIALTGSQIFGSSKPITVTNSGLNADATLLLTDTTIAYSSADGITFANSAATSNSSMFLEMIRSQINNVSNISLDVSATNGSVMNVVLRDSQLAHGNVGLKTSGTVGVGGYLAVSLVRSDITAMNSNAVLHGFGTVRLESSHVVFNTKDFVNGGSGSIVSNGYNMVHDNDNPAGQLYITPSVIPLK